MSTIRHVLLPFAFELWLSVLVAMAVLTVFLVTTSSVSVKCSYKMAGVTRHFSLQNTWHYVFGAFCQQGERELPQVRLSCICPYLTMTHSLTSQNWVLLEKAQSLNHSRNSQHFIELEYSLPCSQELNFSDDGTLTRLLYFWTLSIILFLSKAQCFGDGILSRSSDGTYSVGSNQFN
jgi:hypothetical protein